jgi:hypothetical protein
VSTHTAPPAGSLRWYAARLRRMSPDEVAERVGDAARRLSWSRQQVLPHQLSPLPRTLLADRPGPAPLPAGTQELVDPAAAEAVVAAADRILAGHWPVLGVERGDVLDPDWFLDPISGRRAPQHRLAFRVDPRDETVTGNVKQVWELSRHHHVTVLATAWWLTGEEVYAVVAAAQLRSWWEACPHLCGIHWTSGLELGIRLISWAWVRRLLADWPGVEGLFGEDAQRQLWWHQRYLAAFPSRGTSANNHAIGEAAGRLVAACAFPWYEESATWREQAAAELAETLAANTFPSGLNREQASDYHRFVTELGLVAAAEADAAGVPLPEHTWRLLTASVDAAAAVVDVAGRPPRQGDGDEGRALLLDDPDGGAWAQLLDVGAALTGTAGWWTPPSASVAATLLASLAPGRAGTATTAGREPIAPRVFGDAGLTVLRSAPEDGPEIWCRCDGGPHGLPGIAAHAHADALAVEVRYDGVDVLVDPGTYCYHDQAPWRAYFRSTLAHNTIEIDGVDQSEPAGPFLWSRAAEAGVDGVRIEAEGQTWVGHHDGYDRLGVHHERVVALAPRSRQLALVDMLTALDHRVHETRMALHLGPDVHVQLDGATAWLSWPGRDGARQSATLALPHQLTWSTHHGETDPILGWHSPRFGERVPTTTLLGTGELAGEVELCTCLQFHALPVPGSVRVVRPREEPEPGAVAHQPRTES